ncbi:hypothetical protein ACJX0J_022367 [Zea mays]
MEISKTNKNWNLTNRDRGQMKVHAENKNRVVLQIGVHFSEKRQDILRGIGRAISVNKPKWLHETLNEEARINNMGKNEEILEAKQRYFFSFLDSLVFARVITTTIIKYILIKKLRHIAKLLFQLNYQKYYAHLYFFLNN